MQTAVLWLYALYVLNVEAASCPDGCDCVAYENSLLCRTLTDTLPLVIATNASNACLYVNYNKRLTRVETRRLISANLTYVYLDYNRISRIADNAFRHIRNTSVLSISNNRLTAIDRKVFAPLSKLKYLDLSHNPIHRLEDDAFKNFKKLALLDVSDTLLTSLRFVVAMTPDSLRVNASNNHRLKRLDEETVVASMRMVELILVNDTNLVCRCKATGNRRLCRMTISNYRYKWSAFLLACYGNRSNGAALKQWYAYEDPVAKGDYFVEVYKNNAILSHVLLMSIVLLPVFAIFAVAYRRGWHCCRRRSSISEAEANGKEPGVERCCCCRRQTVHAPMKRQNGDCGTCYPEPDLPTFEDYQQRHLYYDIPAFPRPVEPIPHHVGAVAEGSETTSSADDATTPASD